MIMSAGKSSAKMSVYERTEIDEERRGKDTDIERSDRKGAERGRDGGDYGSERGTHVVTTGRVQEGGSGCHSSWEQGEEAAWGH